MFLYFRRFFCLIRLENLLKIMSLRLCLFYVFRVKTIRFPKRKRRVLTRKTYGSHTENVWFRFGRHKKSRAVERKIVGRFRDFCICQTV